MSKHIDKGRGQTHYDGDDCSPKPQANTLDEIRQKIIKASFSPDYWGEDYSVLSKDQQEFVDKIQALITDAQQNAVAWSIMVLDDLHTDGVDKYAMSADYDKFYKSAKNTIRDRYKNETGVDPAPDYPILSQLKEQADE